MTHALDWFEIPAHDLARAQRFYETLLGTTLRREQIGASALAVFPYAETGVGGCLMAGPGTPALPPGKVIEDEFFGRVSTYRGPVVIRLPLAAGQPGGTVALTVESQGCADAGVCYPPQQQRLALPLPAAGAGPTAPVEASPPKKSYFN